MHHIKNIKPMIKTYGLVLILFFPVHSFKSHKIEPGNGPGFTIEENSDKDFKQFKKKVVVFNIPIYADKNVKNPKLLHAANILARYLDNNEDGIIDNPPVVEQMIRHKAAMVIWQRKTELRGLSKSGYIQDLGANEIVPGWHTNGHTGKFDASIEEIWHLITHAGYANAYPDIFGESEGTALTKAMDIARGGHFTTVPNAYPAKAWYTYYDRTCAYNCMATEYFYWAMTSILGAQENRLSEIQQEWKLNTQTLVQNTDTSIYARLTDPRYKFPTVLPGGTYKH